MAHASEQPPLVSCIIPTYENLELASRALMSALTQEGVALEVIVSDDSKSDSIRDFVEALMPSYPALRYVPGPRNGNAAANWNHGLDAATGEFAVMLHQDEFFLSRRFLKLATDHLRATGERAVTSGVQVIGVSRRSWFPIVQAVTPKHRLPTWTLWLSNWIGPTASIVFRMEGAPRFNEALVQTVDIDFYTYLIGRTGHISTIPGTMVGSLSFHDAQIGSSIHTGRVGYREILDLRAADPYGFSPLQWSAIVSRWKRRARN